MSVWLRMGRDSIRLELLERWERPPVVAPHRGALRSRVREAAGLAADDPPRNGAGIDRACAESPVVAKLLGKLASSGRVCLTIPDATRKGPWRNHLEEAVAWVKERSPGASSRTLLIATGVHRPDAPVDLELPEGWRLAANGERGYAEHRLVGQTSSGTAVRLHPDWVEADLRVILGDISFHYFAGFGGGRKLVFPGLGEPHGILANHKRCLGLDGKLHPGCESGNLAGNPVHEDILEAVALCPPDLLLQAYEPAPGESCVMTAGDWREEHERGCERYLHGHTLEHTQRAEVLIADAGGFPRDASMLQAHKSLRHASRFLAPGGRLLLVAELEDGSGSESFERLWALPAAELSHRAVENYELHTQTALSLRTICESYEVGVLTRMERGRLATAGIEPFEDAAEAILWLESRGRPRTWGWLARAEEVVPRLVGQGGDG